MKKYQLVMKFAATEMADFDRLITFESCLIDPLRSLANVDGHDFGSGEFNIFLITDYPEKAFEAANAVRKSQLPGHIPTVAYRELLGERYTVLWPPGQKEF